MREHVECGEVGRFCNSTLFMFVVKSGSEFGLACSLAATANMTGGVTVGSRLLLCDSFVINGIIPLPHYNSYTIS